MGKGKSYLDGVALGLTLGFMLSILVVWALEDATPLVQKFVSDHVTHAVTLLAAALALLGISRQIQSNFELTERTRLAKLDAAKATLPIVLSNISSLCMERYYAIAWGTKERPDNTRWEITETELTTLKECIEHADGVEKDLMLQICRVYQVLVARWDSLEFSRIFGAPALEEGDTKMLDRLNQFGAISNWAVLRAIATSLFDYSRGAVSNPTNDEILENALKWMEHLHTGTLSGSAGSLLRNNADYNAYLERKVKSKNLEFINDSWDR